MKEAATPEKIKTLQNEGKFQEALLLLEKIVSGLSLEQKKELIKYRYEMSQCLLQMGQLEEAEKEAKFLLQYIDKEQIEQNQVPNILNIMGNISWKRGELDKAKEYFEQIRKVGEQLNEPILIADALYGIGVVYIKRGELDKAEELTKKCIAIKRELGDSKGLAAALNNLGLIQRWKGNPDYAEELMQESYKLRLNIGYLPHIAASLNNLGLIYERKGDLKKAEKYYKLSLDYEMIIGNPLTLAISYNNLGEIARRRGKLAEAESYYLESLKNWKKNGGPADIAISLNNLGIIYSLQGKLSLAEENLINAIKLKNEASNPQNLAISLHYLTKVQIRQNSMSNAENQIITLEKLTQKHNYKDIFIRFLLAKGLLKLEQGDLREAFTLGDEALTQAENLRYFGLLIESLLFLMQISVLFYLTSQDDKYLRQCEELIQRIEQLTHRENLSGSYVEAILLKGLLKRASLDFFEAAELFKQAEKISNELGIELVANRARDELKKVNKQIEILRRSEKIKTQAYEEIKLREVLSYIKEVQKFS